MTIFFYILFTISAQGKSMIKGDWEVVANMVSILTYSISMIKVIGYFYHTVKATVWQYVRFLCMFLSWNMSQVISLCGEVTSVSQAHWTTWQQYRYSLHKFLSVPRPSNQSQEAIDWCGSSWLSIKTWTHFWVVCGTNSPLFSLQPVLPTVFSGKHLKPAGKVAWWCHLYIYDVMR